MARTEFGWVVKSSPMSISASKFGGLARAWTHTVKLGCDHSRDVAVVTNFCLFDPQTLVRVQTEVQVLSSKLNTGEPRN